MWLRALLASVFRLPHAPAGVSLLLLHVPPWLRSVLAAAVQPIPLGWKSVPCAASPIVADALNAIPEAAAGRSTTTARQTKLVSQKGFVEGIKSSILALLAPHALCWSVSSDPAPLVRDQICCAPPARTKVE